MNRLYRLSFLTLGLLTVLLPLCVVAQEEDDSQCWYDWVQEWLDDRESGSIPDEMVDALAALSEHPINLNDTASDDILQLPFITPFQWEIIKAYILQYGQMRSTNELYLLNGFDTKTLRLLRHFVCVKPVIRREPFSLNEELRRCHSNLVMGTRRVLEQSAGYADSSYLGSPYRLYFRYRFSNDNHIILQVSGKKDAGEEFFRGTQPHGFDYYGGYLLLKDFGLLKRTIFGHYQLQFGEGLTLWNGFSGWSSSVLSLARRGQGIKGAGALTEYGFFQGAATQLSLGKHWDVTPFFSNIKRDATVPTAGWDDDGGLLWVQSIYQSGYHRTINEISKKDILNEMLYGSRLQWHNMHLRIGATGYGVQYAVPIIPHRYVYNYNAFAGQWGIALGTDFDYWHDNFACFGELSYARALDTSLAGVPLAGIIGMTYYMDVDHRVGIVYRNYSPTYQNLYSSALGRNSRNQNEQGIQVNWESLLLHQLRVVALFDLYSFPQVKYNVYQPSGGYNCRIKLSQDISQYNTISFQLNYRSERKNTSAVTDPTYWAEEIHRTRMHFGWNRQLNQHWSWRSLVSYCYYSSDNNEPQSGIVAAQEVRYTSTSKHFPATIATKWSMFSVSDYTAALYMPENDLQYEYSSLVMVGNGVRGYLSVRYEPTENIKFVLKYGITAYMDRDSIGSGRDITQGPIRQDVRLQFRWKWRVRHDRRSFDTPIMKESSNNNVLYKQ